MTAAMVLDLATPWSAGSEGLLGLWRMAPSSLDAAAAEQGFGSGEEGWWYVELPPAPGVAAHRLASSANVLEAAGLGIEPAAERLGAVLERCRSSPTFAVAAGANQADPAESELVGWLDSARLHAGGEVSFTSGSGGARHWTLLRQQASGLVADAARWSAPWSWVETRAGGRTVARSRVGLGGNTESVWHAGSGASDVDLHAATIALVVSSRATLLRGLSLAARGAAAAAALALPGGSLLALPAIWRFVNAVIRDRARAVRLS